MCHHCGIHSLLQPPCLIPLCPHLVLPSPPHPLFPSLLLHLLSGVILGGGGQDVGAHVQGCASNHQVLPPPPPQWPSTTRKGGALCSHARSFQDVVSAMEVAVETLSQSSFTLLLSGGWWEASLPPAQCLDHLHPSSSIAFSSGHSRVCMLPMAIF